MLTDAGKRRVPRVEWREYDVLSALGSRLQRDARSADGARRFQAVAGRFLAVVGVLQAAWCALLLAFYELCLLTTSFPCLLLALLLAF